MKQELLHHKLAYGLLLVVLISLTFLFMAVWPNRFLQRLVILVMMVFYTTWGSLTHLHVNQFTPRIFAEYASMSLLAGVMLLLVTL